MFKPLSTIQAVLGPRRQLTATSLGNATGTVGVEVVVVRSEEHGPGLIHSATVFGNECIHEGPGDCIVAPDTITIEIGDEQEAAAVSVN